MNQDIYVSSSRRYTQLPRFFRWFSDHCVLRQLDDSDIARVWRTVSSRGFGHTSSGKAPTSNDEVVEAMRAAQADWLRGTRYALAVLRKTSHDFVGWIELAPQPNEKDAWNVDTFIDPAFFHDPLAFEVIGAAADLMFSALNAQKLLARCPRDNPRFEDILNAQGYIEVAAVGSRDPATGRARNRAQYELGLRDWNALRRAQMSLPGGNDAGGPTTAQWITTGLKTELTLV